MPDALHGYAFLLPTFAQKLRLLARRAQLPPGAQIDQDDLMQEGWVAILRAFSRYDPAYNASFLTYAMDCAQGAMGDAVRAAWRRDQPIRASSRLEALTLRRGWEREARAATAPDPYYAVLQGEQIRQVSRALATVPPAWQHTYVQHVCDEVPCATLAAQEGVGISAVWQRIGRMKRHLAQEVAACHT